MRSRGSGAPQVSGTVQSDIRGWLLLGGARRAAERRGSVPGQVGAAVRVRAHGGGCLLRGYTCGNLARARDHET